MPLFTNTNPQDMLIEIVIIVLLAFMPALIYMVALRYVEKYEREPWGSMFNVFLWGATMGVVAVIIFRGMFYVHFGDYYPDLAEDNDYTELIAAVLITPIIAELVKPIGLLTVRDDINEAEDGLIYGAVAGLGYASTENLLFGMFLVSIFGMDYYIYIVIVRSVSVVLLNASTSALVGYGVSRATAKKHKRGSLWAFPLFLLVAIGMHGFFNLLMVSGAGISDLLTVSTSFLFAIGISIGFMTWIYFKIYLLDRLDEPIEEAKKEREREMKRRREMEMRRDDYYYDDRRDYPPQRPARRDDYYYDQPPPTAHRPPPTTHSPPPTTHSPPPRARRVGVAPREPPPSIYVEQPVSPEARAAKWSEPPAEEPVMDADWEAADSKPKAKRKDKRPPRKDKRQKTREKRSAEPAMEWEEEAGAEEAIDWEEAEEEKPVKKPAVEEEEKVKDIAWGDEEEDEEDWW